MLIVYWCHECEERSQRKVQKTVTSRRAEFHSLIFRLGIGLSVPVSILRHVSESDCETPWWIPQFILLQFSFWKKRLKYWPVLAKCFGILRERALRNSTVWFSVVDNWVTPKWFIKNMWINMYYSWLLKSLTESPWMSCRYSGTSASLHRGTLGQSPPRIWMKWQSLLINVWTELGCTLHLLTTRVVF